MKKFSEEWHGKKVLIFGLGRQGGGAGDLTWLKNQGAIVKVSDKDLTLCPEGQTKEQIDWAEIIIKNPGVPDDHPQLLYARTLNKPVLTSIALFVKYTSLTVIGITGTRGKSTTTALITNLFEEFHPGSVVTGGNIPGTSGLSLFDQEPGRTYAVLELSSFQLHNFHELKVSPKIAVVTNLYPDHLNRYRSMSDYQYDKEAIVKYQNPTDLTLFNRDNDGAVSISQASTGKILNYTAADVMSWKTSLPGLHNRENIAAMWAVAKTFGISESLSKKVVQDFHGLSFRQEKILEFQGVSFINDTTATTPIAAIKAIEAQTQPTVLICGGQTKRLPHESLVKTISENQQVQKVIFLGGHEIPEFTRAIRAVAGDKILGQVDSMKEAISLAMTVAKPGWTVLLSPGFSSFDLFQNEFDRGRQFNSAVNAL